MEWILDIHQSVKLQFQLPQDIDDIDDIDDDNV